MPAPLENAESPRVRPSVSLLRLRARNDEVRLEAAVLERLGVFGTL